MFLPGRYACGPGGTAAAMARDRDILARLAAGFVLGDGGSVFEMERRGYIQAGPYTPEVVLEHPAAVLQMHREYMRCGADVIQALTFYGSADKVEDPKVMNREAVALAREAAGKDGFVAAGLSPTPSFRSGGTESEVRRLMAEHLESQAEGGVDLVVGETFLWLEEALLALKTIKEAGLPAMITMNISGIGSRDGYSPADCARRLEEAGADIVGTNCSHPPDVALAAAIEMRKAVSCYVACQPIAYRLEGVSDPFESWPNFPLGLESSLLDRYRMAEFARKAREAGIDFIGGCCGVGPHHLRAMAEALGRTTGASAKSPNMLRHMIPEVRERFSE